MVLEHCPKPHGSRIHVNIDFLWSQSPAPLALTYGLHLPFYLGSRQEIMLWFHSPHREGEEALGETPVACWLLKYFVFVLSAVYWAGRSLCTNITLWVWPCLALLKFHWLCCCLIRYVMSIQSLCLEMSKKKIRKEMKFGFARQKSNKFKFQWKMYGKRLFCPWYGEYLGVEK